MPSLVGSLRQFVLAPKLSAVTFAERGFPGAGSPAAARLEAVPQSVVCGFEWGIAASGLWELERRLELVEPEQRGFAYEGATMAAAVRDAMAGGSGKRTRELLLGPGQPHLLLAYIGIGFAMARLPRRLWRGIVPDLSGLRYHPTMSWLAVDGYGFDLAYFHTRRYVEEQRQPAPYPWEGSPEYFHRAVDQGIGRALWFINGADPAAVTAAVNRFAEVRRADLWSGVGLAAAFAGGTSPGGLAALRTLAEEHWPQLGLGAVFANKARILAGHVPEHSALAVRTLAGLSVRDADEVADATEASPGSGHAEPRYEQWRGRIRSRIADTTAHVTS
jgi:enediyne biosynthesis protein E2